jgi:hypothetical protein
MRIYVTEDDIASGCRFNPELCPVAQALNRAGLYHFGVFGSAFLLEAKDHAATLLRLPKPVCDWIASFDAGRHVTPVKFDIDLPQPIPDVHRNESAPNFVPCE